MPKDAGLDIAEELSRLTLRDTLLLVRKLGQDKQEAENQSSGFVDPHGEPDVQRHDDRIDYVKSTDDIANQLSFNIDFDNFDFSDVVKKGQIEPAMALEEMQLLANYATLPPPPVVLSPEEQADQFLAFSSFDDVIL